MATLRLENGTVLTAIAEIADALSPLNIQLHHWPIPENPEVVALLGQASLDDTQKETVLAGFDHRFQDLQQSDNYQSRDLVVLHSGIPNLEELLAKFDKVHTHDDDEVRYILEGEGVFGFVLPDERQVELTVQPEEYINVPANTEHWFYLTESRRIKAIRYFTGTEGWVPRYTGREIRPQVMSV